MLLILLHLSLRRARLDKTVKTPETTNKKHGIFPGGAAGGTGAGVVMGGGLGSETMNFREDLNPTQSSWSELVGGQLLKTLQYSHGWEIYVL